ncbi:GGDEF domain-containing protein [Shewanella sp. JM162201]|uniref:GGDEF domain-containing protein n=1 Tax=Shewanella jiangmenensis TaxID=2837387 RepID=A0ABS5V668_9GAMM|nr:GGDEF domain-containing protein [Shewanella jiangmenensis]MBT1445945.1 GGDEF domain-containing protein [Shewanella jiangmenensis]
MSLTKSLPFALVGLFGIAAAFMYQDDKSQLELAAQQHMAQYQQQAVSLDQWSGDGKSLYQMLQAKIPLQFFQYTDATDGARNHTAGVLQASNDSLLMPLFELELGDTRSLSEGRLMIKLDVAALRRDAADAFAKQLAILAALLLGSLGVFAFFSAYIKRGVRYGADYIRTIPELNYQAVEQSKLNGELKPLAAALDECRIALKTRIDNLNAENEKLSRAAYQDPVTGFGSRVRFTRKLDELSKSTKDQIGCLAMVQATELGNINQLQGRTAGDEYLNKIANCLRRAAMPFTDAECFRINSSDFAVFLPNLIIKDAERFLEPLKTLLDEYQGNTGTDSVAYTGLVPYKNGLDPVNLLSLSDAALSIAQTLGPNSFHTLEKFTDDVEIGDNRWQLAIRNIIERRAVRFFQQPIQPCRTEVEVYRELFARFYNPEGKILPTTTVIAMAERHGLIIDLDKLVLMSAIRTLLESPNLSGAFGVNISATSATNDSFVGWLKDTLIKHRTIAPRLVLEINESGVQTNMQGCFKFIRDMHGVGTRVAIERFGMGFTSFKFFREIRPDYIKLDATYSEAIDQDANNKFFVRMIVDIARRIGVRVLACGVERQEEKFTLEKLLVDGLQGYYIAQPKALGNEPDDGKSAQQG